MKPTIWPFFKPPVRSRTPLTSERQQSAQATGSLQLATHFMVCSRQISPVTTGIVNSLSGILNDTRYLQISAQIEPGNSGGPLLDTSGNVVGVVAEKLNAIKFAKIAGDIPQNVNFAIKTGAVRDFLDNSVVPYQTSDPVAELKIAEIARNARAYTMLISCSVKAEETSKK
jgi:Trypsin-like peptidase domain